ncbi:hypothetical protein ABE137_12805 [Brevibacillus laterosporus]|uniref:Uncharacterized protein n=1 Tax=Brevibacillus halotolerans TaxID=1507437 RepID=A0ABT4HWI3_9BACL|nr:MULTISPECIES: hypothetical protein [Brevibacillus]MCR8985352.1 hypothetical protein [Brevibacillus laterosporus]MCZ0831082.1 hypothetical protein [Brevibacillus halotolerans]OAJ75648.1 hypothetical protein AYJ08_21460 [Brevibacillus sp. SKDU10]GIO00007.1 hypothetical protein J5TS2_06750 [Brevibacillus halotolerans]
MPQPYSVRVFYPRQMGRSAKNINMQGVNITNTSVVLISAAQFIRGGPLFNQNARLTVHGPDVYVTNISPHGPEGGPDGGVEFMLHVNSNTPIDVAVTISVFGPFDNWLIF